MLKDHAEFAVPSLVRTKTEEQNVKCMSHKCLPQMHPRHRDRAAMAATRPSTSCENDGQKETQQSRAFSGRLSSVTITQCNNAEVADVTKVFRQCGPDARKGNQPGGTATQQTYSAPLNVKPKTEDRTIFSIAERTQVWIDSFGGQ